MADETTTAVVFDPFGTLVPISADSYRRVLRVMADAIGVEHERFAQAWVSSKRELETGCRRTGIERRFVAAQLGVVPTSAAAAQAVQAWLETSEQRLKPSARTLRCLGALRGHGRKIGRLTNCAADVPYTWPNGELASLVDYAGFSWKLGHMKPDRGGESRLASGVARVLGRYRPRFKPGGAERIRQPQ